MTTPVHDAHEVLEPEYIERPVLPVRTVTRTLSYPGLIETATNGKAIRVPLQGLTHTKVQARLRSWLRFRGYRLRYLYDAAGASLTCWAEPLPPSSAEAADTEAT